MDISKSDVASCLIWVAAITLSFGACNYLLDYFSAPIAKQKSIPEEFRGTFKQISDEIATGDEKPSILKITANDIKIIDSENERTERTNKVYLYDNWIKIYFQHNDREVEFSLVLKEGIYILIETMEGDYGYSRNHGNFVRI